MSQVNIKNEVYIQLFINAKKTCNDKTLIMSFHKYIFSFNMQFILALEFLRWSMFEKPYCFSRNRVLPIQNINHYFYNYSNLQLL